MYPGVTLEGYEPPPSPPDPPAVGYLAHLLKTKGLETLVDAFMLLKQSPAHQRVRLRIAGAMTNSEKRFVHLLQRKIASHGLSDHVDFLTNISLEDKQAFLRTLTILSVPATYGEAFGQYIIEALASGVPVVQPSHAAFPEIIAQTGGLLCEPDNATSLAEKLDYLLTHPDEARQMGIHGRKVVTERFTVDLMTQDFLNVLETVAHP